MKNITVISGSVREGRKSHFVAKLLLDQVSAFENIQATILDLKDYPFPLMTDTHLDKWPVNMKIFCEQLSKSNGIIMVSPEYKNSMPGALKNALDYLPPQVFKHIPVSIVTVSSADIGGLNCLSQLRLVCLAMGGIVIPEKLCVSKVNEVFDETGNLKDISLKDRLARFIDSFLWYVNRLSL